MKPKNDSKLEAKEPYILKTCVVELGRIRRSSLGSSGIEEWSTQRLMVKGFLFQTRSRCLMRKVIQSTHSLFTANAS
jgi:hypothetical protein